MRRAGCWRRITLRLERARAEFLGRAESDTDVKEAKRLIMATGVVPKILGKQKNDGYWEKAEKFHIKSKYRGTRARR